MNSSRFRDPRQNSEYVVVIAPIEQKQLRIVAINEARAAQEAKKLWRRQNGPRVLSVRLDEAA